MSWDEHHSHSERLAAEGERAARSGDRAAAEALVPPSRGSGSGGAK